MLLRLYYLYKRAPKKLRQLKEIYNAYKEGVEFNVGGYRPKKCNSTQWISHKIAAMKMCLDKWGINIQHLENICQDPSTKTIEQAKLKGYLAKWNGIFPAGILQAPYFKYDYPKFVNYGGMGSVIGHEITHGFDNNGRLYDAQGNYHNDSWWSKESVVKFKDRSNCFVNEYSKFSEAKYNIKGNVTLGENLADNGGLKASFKAYKMWVEKNGEELMLPGLGKSNDEVFFIAFAQSWCTSKLSNVLIDQINTDVHSPEFDRVRGSVKFNKDFAKIFNCPIGSPMNPEVKCSVW
nr:unnamed protein product [Hydra vulgaris]